MIPAVESRAQDLAADRAALVALYNATGGANWTNNTNWLSTTEPVGNWHGVGVANGRVTSLALRNNQLTGTIPSQLGSLSNLTNLLLDRNQLTGSIPTQLGNLANLVRLVLNDNQLTGSIPTQLGNLSNLELLLLYGNQLTGSIPTQLGNLANLEWLWLSNNRLTGSVPTQVGNLSNLTILRLNGNRLTGPLPRSLTSLNNLRTISFGNGPAGLCAPADTAFQNWLQAIERREGGPNCSADNYSIPGRTPLTYPKAGSVLDDLIDRFESGEITAEEAAQEAPLHRGDAVAVTIHLQSGNVSAMVTFLQNNGVTPRNQGEDFIEAFVPIRLLGPVSQQTGVLRMGMIQPPEPDQMAIPGNGPVVHGSPAWNSAGYSGQGVKVGVIDGGFIGISDLLGTELPASVQARCYTGSSDTPTSTLSVCEDETILHNTAHGTVVAESVLDIAPEVELYIANPYSDGDLHDSVAWMADQGVRVINHSMGHLLRGPGDGTSPYADSPLKAVDRAVDNGIVWVNSAGNAAQKTWFKRAPFSFSSSGLIHFNGSDSTNRVYLRKGQRIRVQLRWDDNWTTGATSDLDLHIGNSSTGAIAGSADEFQTGNPGETPFEFLVFVAPSDGQYDLLVERFSGAVPGWIQLTAWVNWATLEHSTANGSIGNPGESASAGMLTVGAARWDDVNSIESYSSQGPLPDGRIKPDVVGAACGETATWSSFCGTSQASPHVAGMAALVRQGFPQATPAQVVAYLKDNAEQRVSNPDPNNTWGHGFAVLPATLLHTISCADGSTVPNPASNPGLVRDCETLLSSRDPLRGNGNLNWSGSVPITMWQGIILGGSPRRVRELALGSNNDLTGSIPAELGNLDGLELLSIINNQLTGTIPAELGNLANLRGLNLNNNQLTGAVPAELGNLANLRGLNLGNNQLTGPIPSWLGNRVTLVGLNLGNNQLTGTIPSQLGNLANLQQLRLENNQLAGNLPHSLANLGALQIFDFFLNPGLCAQDDSTIQAWLNRVNYVRGPDCTPTVRLSVTPSHLIEGAGATPVTVTAMRVAASSNTTVNLRRGGSAREWRDYTVTRALSITIPANATSGTTTLTFTPLADGVTEGDENVILQAVVVENQTEAIEGSAVITLSDEGTSIPCATRDRAALEALYNATGGPNWTNDTNWLSSLPLSDWHGVTADSNGCVTRLDLRSNQLTGTIPTELSNLASLTVLDLYYNQLTGSIPSELGNLASLQLLNFRNNQLTGSIPSELGNLANLLRLDLHSNQLTGAIPSQLGNLASLRTLGLPSNQLTGAIPTELGNLANLRTLYLANNQLTGTIPTELGNLANLRLLWLSNNQLTESIPTELGNLANLQDLDLYSNQLTGSIPPELGNLASLEVLFLRRNQLTGGIPVELGNLANLRSLLLERNQLTGEIPAELGDLANLNLLGLSSNQLTGDIPAELSNLNNLGPWLDLSRNQLTGTIPSWLGNHANTLVDLYLYDNQLTGTIPTELGDLANLRSLWLNDNQVTGNIPTSFTGLGALSQLYFYLNPGLCAQDSGLVRTWLNGVSDVRGPDCTSTVSLTVNPSRLVEGGGNTDVMVTARRTAVSTDTHVNLRFGGSAEQRTDYTLTGFRRLTIPANNAEGTAVLTVTPLTDSLAEDYEIIIVEAVVDSNTEGSAVITLSDPGGLLPSISSATPYSLTVSWDEPAGGPFIDYDVRYRISGSSAAFTDAQHAGTARTATLTGLTPDTTYEVQVRATNAMGTGAWSGPVQGRTKPLLPGVSGNIPIYYFPHLAVGAGWQTTITYINYSPQAVTCQTHFISDHGSALPVSFPGLGAIDSRTDVLPPGGSVHEETDVALQAPPASGWALAACSGPVKASLLFRGYDSQGAPTAEAGVNAAAVPTTRFVTFAEQGKDKAGTGVAYANPSSSTAIITLTAKDAAGQTLASVNQTLLPGGHGAQNMASLFGLSSFAGSLEVTSTEPIVSLSLNAEAAPVFSSLPPGEPDANAQGPTTYYFPHLAVGASWQTTITYINYSSAQVVCKTDFISDHGGPLLVSFPGQGMVESRTDILPPGGAVHKETDVALSGPLAPGWARATCSEPVKASLLFRQYNSQGEPVAEAGVNAAAAPARRFVTFAEQAAGKAGTGVAYANPSTSNTASVFFTARNTAGDVLNTVVRTLLPGGHDAQNVVALFGLTSFTGSLEVTSTEPIVSLSLNFEAAPVFSSLPPGEVDP